MKTNTVTSMVARTCSNTLPVGSPPYKLTMNRSSLKAKNKNKIKIRIGTTLATVTMLLINGGLLDAAQDHEVDSQRMTDATIMATAVLPSPNTGKNAPSVDLIRTQ